MHCRAGLVVVIVLLLSQSVHPSDLLDAVVEGYESNYSKIESVEARYEEKSGSGKTSKTFDLTVFVKRSKVRVDRKERDGQQREVFVFKENAWTQYMQTTRNSAGLKGVAWVRNKKQMPGLFPMDVRQEICQLVSQDYLSMIRGLLDRKEKLVDSKTVEVSGKTHADSTLRVYFLCDAEKSFLPVLMYTDRIDGTGIVQRVDIRYASVLDGKAWWPRETRRSFFGKGETDPDSSSATSTVSKTLKGELFVNEHIGEDVFSDYIFKPGTEIRDTIVEERRFVVGR